MPATRTAPQCPFDPEDPPPAPPWGCLDPMLWHVAYALYQAHRPHPDGFCECRQYYPCPGHRLAIRGLLRSCLPNKEHRWHEMYPPLSAT